MKTNELQGPALDWAVAKCEGTKIVDFKHGRATFIDPTDDGALNEMFINYSTDWEQGGPIIEREGVSMEFRPMGSMHEWVAFCGEDFEGGETPLIAAMRCYVASKLGDEVEVPKELFQGEQA